MCFQNYTNIYRKHFSMCNPLFIFFAALISINFVVLFIVKIDHCEVIYLDYAISLLSYVYSSVEVWVTKTVRGMIAGEELYSSFRPPQPLCSSSSHHQPLDNPHKDTSQSTATHEHNERKKYI